MINIKNRLKTHYRNISILGIPKLGMLRDLIRNNIRKRFESKNSNKKVEISTITITENTNVAKRPEKDCEKPRNFRLKAMHRKAVKKKKT